MTISNRKHEEFNKAMAEAIDEAIRELFSPQVLETLYNVLSTQYGVTRDELPYRLETAYKILTDVFGMRGAETIGRMIIRRLYQKLDLQFEGIPGLRIMDYVDIAKRKLAQTEPMKEPNGKAKTRQLVAENLSTVPLNSRSQTFRP